MANKSDEMKINWRWIVDYESHTEYPGCPGCRPGNNDSFDYCRCGRISSVTIKFEPENIRSAAKDIEHYWKIIKKANISNVENKKFIIYCIDRILRNMGINSDSFEADIGQGYYGEEIQGINLDYNIENDLRKHVMALLNMDITECVKYILKLEYGYLLPRIENSTFKLETISRKEIIVPNRDYYFKIDKSMQSVYKNWNLPVCVLDENYGIIDGYHRYLMSENKKKILVIKAEFKENENEKVSSN